MALMVKSRRARSLRMPACSTVGSAAGWVYDSERAEKVGAAERHDRRVTYRRRPPDLLLGDERGGLFEGRVRGDHRHARRHDGFHGRVPEPVGGGALEVDERHLADKVPGVRDHHPAEALTPTLQ